MNGKYIVNLHDSGSPWHATTKNYVDTSIERYQTGYMPIWEDNNSELRLIASSSGSPGSNSQPYGVFNCLNEDSLNWSWVVPATTGWLQIQGPEVVVVLRIALKATAIASKDKTA